MSEAKSSPLANSAEATIARLEAELAVTKRRLDETRHELDAFAYSVSHDLRGPLRALNGFSKLLKDEAGDVLTGDTADYLARIVAATHRLELLLEDMLVLARAGRAAMQIQPLDLGAMAKQIASELDASAPDRSVDWQIADARIMADPALLRSALEHMLGNAFKFTGTRDRAAIELIVERNASEPAQEISGFSILDNGVGFDMAFADRLFSPFQRLHPASEYAGNGIGLALVQRIARRHGGRAWIESVPQQGTQVFFRVWESGPPVASAA